MCLCKCVPPCSQFAWNDDNFCVILKHDHKTIPSIESEAASLYKLLYSTRTRFCYCDHIHTRPYIRFLCARLMRGVEKKNYLINIHVLGFEFWNGSHHVNICFTFVAAVAIATIYVSAFFDTKNKSAKWGQIVMLNRVAHCFHSRCVITSRKRTNSNVISVETHKTSPSHKLIVR